MAAATILETFQNDHRRLDELFESYQRYKGKDFSKAREYFKIFKEGLETHINWEQKLIFPLYEFKTKPEERGIIDFLLSEHQEIKRQLLQMWEKFQKNTLPGGAEDEEFLDILGEHNAREEYKFYAQVDRLSSGSEVQSLLSQIKFS